MLLAVTVLLTACGSDDEAQTVSFDILLNGEPVDALSTLTHVDNSVTFG